MVRKKRKYKLGKSLFRVRYKKGGKKATSYIWGNLPEAIEAAVEKQGYHVLNIEKLKKRLF